MDSYAFKAHCKRSEKAWAERTHWQTLYDEVYDYVIPYRRPARSLTSSGKGSQRVDKLYDNTAMVSAFSGAGRLQQDLFPPGQPFFTFKLGPVAKMALKRQKIDLHEAKRELETIAEEVQAFFASGEFDNAANEMCIDLIAGTGALFPLDGDDNDPVRFVCIPFDELAIEPDGFGGVAAIFWCTIMTRRQIKAAFPRGQFPAVFSQSQDEDGEIRIHQDWIKDAAGWSLQVWIEEGDADNGIIASDRMTAQPGAIVRYHKVPGEAYGRGPGMLALPTAKTLNKAVELMLKAAAIQMLGIWAYRPGGAFNPSTARFAPGAFWAMSSTGGVIGPDVTRLDPSTARMEIAQLITQELRLQLQAAMNDDKLPDKGATPVSATEVMARMKRISQNYLGAYGRITNDTIPPLVRRVMEIADKRKLLSRKIKLDTLLLAIDITSPMAAMMKAQGLSQALDFLQIVATLKGPQAIELLVKLDDLLRDLGERMGVPAAFLMTKEETQALEQKLAAAAAAMAAAQQQAAAGPPQPEPVPA